MKNRDVSSMKRKVILHIGLSKTGSTSIQQFLSENREKLKQQGIYHPQLFGERIGQSSIVAFAATETGIDFSPFVKATFKIYTPSDAKDFDDRFLSRFHEVIGKSASATTTVLSSELLSKELKDKRQLLKLQKLLNKYFDEITILVYLKPQETRIVSMLSQALKGGNTPNFEKFINRELDYDREIGLWSSVFGHENLVIRILEKDSLFKTDLIKDFYHCLGGSNIKEMNISHRENESISYGAALFLRKFNQNMRKINPNPGPNKLRGRLVEFLEKYSQGKEKYLLDTDQIDNIRKRHEASNESIRKSFFPERDQLFSFADVTFGENSVFTLNESIEISTHLWLEQQKLIIGQRTQLSALKDEGDKKSRVNEVEKIASTIKTKNVVDTVAKGKKPDESRNPNFRSFGREIKSEIDLLKSDERLFEMEGSFVHHGSRLNIAQSKYWAAEMTHPKDIRNFKNLESLGKRNHNKWCARKDDKIEEVGGFNPLIDVAIYDISVEVSGIPIENYNFLLGDGCIYMEQHIDSYPKLLPAASEAHCTAVSLNKSSKYNRRLGVPEDFPLYLSKRESLQTHQHFTRHMPHIINPEDLEMPRVRSRIRYKPYDPSITVHKFLRIPYLDQYPAKPTLIQKDRPWYKSWDENEPLVVRGFSIYFSPKPPIAQHLDDLAVYAIDKNGKEIPGKRIEMSPQIAGGGKESLSLDPMFFRGDITIEPGEFLSASSTLLEGTPTADLAIFVLVEIPKSRVPSAWGAPLFYSQGCANLDYLRNHYDSDRINHVSTPAAKQVLRSISLTEIKPWSDNLGVKNWPKNPKKIEKLFSDASSFLFVD